MDKKSKYRMRLLNLRTVGPNDKTATEGPTREVIGISLGHRLVISEQAEVWTVVGELADGTVTKEEVGELSFVLIPGETEPATAVTGFVAAPPSYSLGITDAALQEQLRSIIMQLGYEREGYYVAVGVGGRFFYDEDYRKA